MEAPHDGSYGWTPDDRGGPSRRAIKTGLIVTMVLVGLVGLLILLSSTAGAAGSCGGG